MLKEAAVMKPERHRNYGKLLIARSGVDSFGQYVGARNAGTPADKMESLIINAA